MVDKSAPPSFDDIAVALALAAAKLKLDVEMMEVLCARVDLSQMGTSIAMSELQRNLDLVVHAHLFFKNNAAVETEVRAMASRKKTGRWGMFSKAAAL